MGDADQKHRDPFSSQMAAADQKQEMAAGAGLGAGNNTSSTWGHFNYSQGLHPLKRLAAEYNTTEQEITSDLTNSKRSLICECHKQCATGCEDPCKIHHPKYKQKAYSGSGQKKHVSTCESHRLTQLARKHREYQTVFSSFQAHTSGANKRHKPGTSWAY
jgi:hypothetical protein